ncbi:hypothetical protein DWY25_16510 [Holdemania filiformis]|uniref:Uncharacterized protein n=1 Tax=Holdemania filiformis TaxID=61171 RepID=A0A412FI33_9FIRM|nr:hypothetical protein DWY25_16510 [Holdemania filiformis]
MKGKPREEDKFRAVEIFLVPAFVQQGLERSADEKNYTTLINSFEFPGGVLLRGYPACMLD